MFPAIMLSALLQMASPSASPTASFDALVHAHVREMIAHGYAQALSWDDLYHGHLFVPRSDVTCYESMDDLLARTALVLYHTAEHNYRWGLGTVPPEQKVPRSIIGFVDGHVLPAIDVIGREHLQSDVRYRAYGTVGIEDVVRVRPDLSHGNAVGDTTCVLLDGAQRPTSFEFHIAPDGVVTFGRE